MDTNHLINFDMIKVMASPRKMTTVIVLWFQGSLKGFFKIVRTPNLDNLRNRYSRMRPITNVFELFCKYTA